MNVKKIRQRTRKALATFIVPLVLVALAVTSAQGTIVGLKSADLGTTFNFTAKAGYVSFADGGTATIWGFADNSTGQVQHPGPTLIVNQGQTITIQLSNELPEPVSLIFPGLGGASNPVFATPGDRATLRSLAQETSMGLPGAPSAPVAYTFTATRPGTFYYQSGTNVTKQVYMGLYGAIIVRPSGYNEVNVAGNDTWTLQDPPALPSTAQQAADLTRHAYGGLDPDPVIPGADLTAFDTRYQREYLYIFHEIDPRINQMVAAGGEPDFTDFKPVYWTLNGRSMPDCLFPHGIPWMPQQPYGALALMHPGERVLVRFINMGRDPHPFHTHTNHMRILAHDGNVLQTGPAEGADLSHEQYTLSVFPGQTYDTIFEWTGQALGWDIYGHAQGFATQLDCEAAGIPLAPFEDANDHCMPFPSTVPDPNNTTFGGFWSGSPFMGAAGSLPPGEGGLNPWNGYVAIWHSHAEKELVNNDIFPGGMLTFMVEAPYFDDTGGITPIDY